ncbi:MAG: DUF3299 domain-containing protein [Bacteroidota bacterium]
MRNIMMGLILTLCVCAPLSSIAQQKIGWDLLGEIKYDFVYHEEYKAYYNKMMPSEGLEAIDGEYVRITGFILPVSTDGEVYFLSAYPYSACFFCGGAGQESVIELRFKNKPGGYQVDEIKSFAGKFKLNDVPFEMNYILEEAVEFVEELK